MPITIIEHEDMSILRFCFIQVQNIDWVGIMLYRMTKEDALLYQLGVYMIFTLAP